MQRGAPHEITLWIIYSSGSWYQALLQSNGIEAACGVGPNMKSPYRAADGARTKPWKLVIFLALHNALTSMRRSSTKHVSHKQSPRAPLCPSETKRKRTPHISAPGRAGQAGGMGGRDGQTGWTARLGMQILRQAMDFHKYP